MKTDLFVKEAYVSILKIPLLQPFRTALGEHKYLENILFSITLADGTHGFGEAAIATHITGETVSQTKRNLENAGREIVRHNIKDLAGFSKKLHEQFSDNKAAVAAVETALLDALTRQKGIPLWKFFGKKLKKLQSDITIVISSLEQTEDSVRKFYKQGFRAFKVKIGRGADLDFKRVLAVRRLAPRSRIYLDANQGYSANETLSFLKSLENAGVRPDLIEQPVPKEDWEGLKEVSRLSKIPVCADESVKTFSDAKRAIREKACSVINVKLMKSGMFESREIALLAKKNGIKLMIGGMMESSLSMTAAAHLAAGLGCFDYVDLDTPFFLKHDLSKNPYLNSRGIYRLGRISRGIGFSKITG